MPRSHVIPPLAQTCHQIRHEVLALTFRRHTLQVVSFTDAHVTQTAVWLQRWRKHGARFRHIAFEGTGRLRHEEELGPIPPVSGLRRGVRKPLSQAWVVDVRCDSSTDSGYGMMASMEDAIRGN